MGVIFCVDYGILSANEECRVSSAHLELGRGREMASNGSSSRGYKNSLEGGIFLDCLLTSCVA